MLKLKKVNAVLSIALALSVTAHAETAAQKAARMKWFNESRFGMFIHWGLYSIPAGEWPGKGTNHAEWIRETAHIPIEDYNKLQAQFNPVKFDPDKIVLMAKNAGMKYIVITTKHHDGFNLFDSHYTDWSIKNTPYKKDVIKMLAEACARHGMKMCFYHSIMDWHHPDYLPRRSWEVKDRPEGNADFRKFVEYLRNDVTQLLTEYGPVGLMWFDGEWESTWNHKDGQALYDLCRKLQPNVIVNNRVDVGRSGMEGFAPGDRAGDYGTPEQTIPANGMGAGNYWETCMTMNNNWGFNKRDKNFKNSTDIIQKLSDIASKGGNFLLNVGPDSLGEVPQESQNILAEVGKWMNKNNEAIYNTDASPFDVLPKDWRATIRPGKRVTALYQLIFNPRGDLTINGLGNEIVKAELLDSKTPITMERVGNTGFRPVLPRRLADSPVTVVKLTLKGEPVIYQAPVLDAVNSATTYITRGKVALKPGARGLAYRFALNREPGATDPVANGPIPVSGTGKLFVKGFVGNRAVTATLQVPIASVKPMPATTPGARNGLIVSLYKGTFSKVGDMLRGRPVQQIVLPAVAMTPDLDKENWGAVLEGTFDVATEDVYQFALTSDDGSRLFIDGQLVVDSDGLHSSLTKAGSVGLAKGAHKIRVEWFNQTGSAELKLEWKSSTTPAGVMNKFKF